MPIDRAPTDPLFHEAEFQEKLERLTLRLGSEPGLSLSRGRVTELFTQFTIDEGRALGFDWQREFPYPANAFMTADVVWFDRVTQAPLVFWEIDSARRAKNLVKLGTAEVTRRCWLYWGRKPIDRSGGIRASRTRDYIEDCGVTVFTPSQQALEWLHYRIR